MGYYYEGYYQARKRVEEMTEAELWDLIDDLFGRDNLSDGCSMEELRAEALVQLEREFTDTNSPEYETVTFWEKVVEAHMKYERI